MRFSVWREILFEAITSFYVIAAVILLWQKPAVATAALALGLALQLLLWRTRADMAAMAAAALLGTPAEMAAVHFGVWTYHAPGLVMGVPIWLPLVWAFLFCLFRRMSFTLLAMTRQRPGVNRWIHRAGAGLILAYGVAIILVVRRTIAVIYAVTFLPAVAFWRKDRDVLIFIVAGVLGTFGEYLCMRLGFWHYKYPILKSIGLPVSLPLAWGLSGVIICRLARIWEKPEELEARASVRTVAGDKPPR